MNMATMLKILSAGGEAGDALLGIVNQEWIMPNIPLQVIDGGVFWMDLVEVDGWRIQQNHITHHARILNDDNVRVAWGTINGMEKMLRRLTEIEDRFLD